MIEPGDIIPWYYFCHVKMEIDVIPFEVISRTTLRNLDTGEDWAFEYMNKNPWGSFDHRKLRAKALTYVRKKIDAFERAADDLEVVNRRLRDEFEQLAKAE